MATARQLPADVYPETLSRLPPLKRATLNGGGQYLTGSRVFNVKLAAAVAS